ncbi:DUF669 domain-containing protein [Spartinivicinus ruber]|uniref:DUF669 domain-containing protein n=1 Tax=Spartinivicinus ruber TaxID=2683272 RepID=UPI0013D10FEF|nr:DUF669 domain-containing protein [Spartinivicinus ruber]
MANFGFNLSEHPPEEGFKPIPPGDYPAIITEAEIKPNSANTGAYIKVKFVITEGEYVNRVIFNNYNISHPNPQAEQIGRGQLSALCLAIGLPNASDSDQLLNQSCMITLKIKNNPQYGPQNEIKGYAPIAQPMQPQAPQQQPIAAHTPPFNQPGQQSGW